MIVPSMSVPEPTRLWIIVFCSLIIISGISCLPEVYENSSEKSKYEEFGIPLEMTVKRIAHKVVDLEMLDANGAIKEIRSLKVNEALSKKLQLEQKVIVLNIIKQQDNSLVSSKLQIAMDSENLPVFTQLWFAILLIIIGILLVIFVVKFVKIKPDKE